MHLRRRAAAQLMHQRHADEAGRGGTVQVFGDTKTGFHIERELLEYASLLSEMG